MNTMTTTETAAHENDARTALVAAQDWMESEASQLRWALDSGTDEDRARCAANLGAAVKEVNDRSDEVALAA